MGERPAAVEKPYRLAGSTVLDFEERSVLLVTTRMSDKRVRSRDFVGVIRRPEIAT